MIIRWLYFLFAIWPAIAEESKVIPVGHLEGKELGAIIPKELYGVAIYFLAKGGWELVKYIWKGKEKRESETSTDIKRIFELLHKLEGRVGELKAAPSEELILMRLKPYVKSEVLENLMKFKGKNL